MLHARLQQFLSILSTHVAVVICVHLTTCTEVSCWLLELTTVSLQLVVQRV